MPSSTDQAVTHYARSASPPGGGEGCLVVIYGLPQLGRRFTLAAETTLGRDAECDIVLDRPEVSRRHAKVFPRGGRWVIRDLGSTNGTQVEGADVNGEVELSSGDQVRLGGVILKYIAGSDVEALFHEAIYRMSIMDGLTGVHNRRALMEFLDREAARAERYGSALWLVLLDLDHFKDVNDTHGHLAGDHVLQQVAARVAARVRREQLLARFGGEEFALVAPELDAERVRAFCETLRAGIAAAPFIFDGEPVRMTVSIGAAAFVPGMSLDDLIEAADAEMYRAKEGGRDRVCLRGAHG